MKLCILPSIKSTAFLSLLFTNCIKFGSKLFFFSASLNKLAKILFVLKASEPPLKITAFPDLKHKLETSDVTFGLLSYINPIIPIGTETLFIVSPLGLCHLLSVTFVGSLSFAMFLTPV